MTLGLALGLALLRLVSCIDNIHHVLGVVSAINQTLGILKSLYAHQVTRFCTEQVRKSLITETVANSRETNHQIK